MKDKNPLISNDYKENNKLLHKQSNYGQTNHSINTKITKIVEAASRQKICGSILDYGCGKGLLVEQLANTLGKNIVIQGYDPGYAKYDVPYKPADIVTCFDVLEHIESEHIDAVLNDISTSTIKFFICIIDLLPAVKKLSDGRNAHILLAPPGWWVEKLTERFMSGHYAIYNNGKLNKKLCYLGVNNPKLLSLGSEIFAKTFF